MDFNKKVFCFWMNDGELPEIRKKNLQLLSLNCGVPVELITKYNLNDWIIENEPLHPSFEFLSEVHKSDYLRCYFMHHYGGGYSDIKNVQGSWVGFFNFLVSTDKFDVIGYQEQHPDHIANTVLDDFEPFDNEVLKENYNLLIGCGAFICKPKTSFTEEWFELVNKKLSQYYDLLKSNPAQHPRDHKKPNTISPSNYPLYWSGILGNIFHPLCFKHRNRIMRELHYPIMSNYQ
jgi:hypothetical protein